MWTRTLMVMLLLLAVLSVLHVVHALTFNYYADSSIGFDTWNLTVNGHVIVSMVNFYPGIYFNESYVDGLIISTPYLPFNISGTVFVNGTLDLEHVWTFAVSVVDCNVTVWKLSPSKIVIDVDRDTETVHNIINNISNVPPQYRKLLAGDFCIVMFELYNISKSLDVGYVTMNGTLITRVSDMAKLFDFSIQDPRYMYIRDMGLLFLVLPVHSQYIVTITFTEHVLPQVKYINVNAPSTVRVNETFRIYITVTLAQSPRQDTQLSGTFTCSGPAHVEKQFIAIVHVGETQTTTMLEMSLPREGEYTCYATIGTIRSNTVHITVLGKTVIVQHRARTSTTMMVLSLLMLTLIVVAVVLVLERERKHRITIVFER